MKPEFKVEKGMIVEFDEQSSLWNGFRCWSETGISLY